MQADLLCQEEEWGSDAAPRDVTITSLQMLARPGAKPRALATGARLERAEHASPELARWLYSVVGGPWRWYERLGWSYEQWAEELAEAGSEIWVLTFEGTPAGYCQLAATVHTDAGLPATHTEILYFGLMSWAQGRGLGGVFLEQMIARAWSLEERAPLPAVQRVWVHTCDLDSPAALPNYLARGFEVFEKQTSPEVVLKEPLGSWVAMFSR